MEPVPDAPAATADLDGERALVVADYHAGIERALRYERGVELDSAADERRARLLALLDETRADRVVVVGDLAHRVGGPGTADSEEIDALVEAVTDRVPLTLVRGNHDAGIADDRIDIRPASGWRVDDVAFCHGHAWPSPALLGASTCCVGHEHPMVRVADAVGGARVERAWLRGSLRKAPFADHHDLDPGALPWGDPELVVCPAFNDRSGGTWVNEDEAFLAPFLPDGLADGADAYLLDGTLLGDYRAV